MYYAAYGSNLHKKDMLVRTPNGKPVGSAFLTDHKLEYRGKDGHAFLTIVPAKGCKVPVGIWYVDDKDLDNLDVYEDYPRLYNRFQLEFPLEQKAEDAPESVKAWIYAMRPGEPAGLPGLQYVQTCKEGYEDFGFDPSFLPALPAAFDGD